MIIFQYHLLVSIFNPFCFYRFLYGMSKGTEGLCAWNWEVEVEALVALLCFWVVRHCGVRVVVIIFGFVRR